MYLRSLHVRNVKLLRDVGIDFTGSDGQPRMWTVFVGENRLCKTTLLQTIAAAACGTDRGTQLVTDVVASWPDLRDPQPIEIDAEFGFSEQVHPDRIYPGRNPSPAPPRLWSKLALEPDKRVFAGGSGYIADQFISKTRPVTDPLTAARSQSRPDWFTAGYGPSRLLRSTGMARQTDPPLDRLRSLFGHELVGIGFIELLEEDLGRTFTQALQSVFVESGLLPHVKGLELRGRGGLRSVWDLINAQRFEMDVAHGKRIHVPATWLSQGYQTLIAWLADVIGHILLDTRQNLQPEAMEGLVLIDEIDLHLHPTWQVRLIPALKRVFPRLQFIATTHSPMVLPALTSDEIFLLSQDDQGSVVVTPSARSPALLTGSELLDTFFAIHALYPSELGDKASDYRRLATDPTRAPADDDRLLRLRDELAAAGIVFDWEPVAREADA